MEKFLNYDVKKLSKQELLDNTLLLSKKERSCTLALISHLEEIESRRLYAEMGFSSMFAYVTKCLGHSENEAQVRISSMRLSRSNPEIKGKISSGELSLTNAGLAAASIKRQENTRGKKLNIEEKSRIIESVSNKSARDAKMELEALEGSITTNKVVYKIEISERGLQMVRELKKAMGNYQDGELLELLLAEKLQLLQQKEEKTEVDVNKENKKKKESAAKSNESGNNDNKKPTRYIPKKVREEVRKRAKSRCEYVSPITGLRCEEVHQLQYDHHPIAFANSGPSTTINLKLKCKAHNYIAAIATFGREKMDKYLQTKSTVVVKSDRAAIDCCKNKT